MALASQTGGPNAPPTPDPTDTPTNDPGNDKFEVTPASYEFPAVCAGDTATNSFTITNQGNTDLHVDGIASTAAAFQTTPAAPPDLLVGQSATFDVVFAPSSAGKQSADIVVTANGKQETVQVFGEGRDTEISVAPRSLSFGALRVGSVSATRDVVIANTGSEPMNLTSITLTGSGDFTKGPTPPVVLQPSAQLRVPITFSPRALGKRFATLRVASDSCNAATRTVSLSGTGGQPGITVTPATLVVSAAVGTNGVPGAVTILSSGLTTLTVRSLSLTGAAADQFTMTGAPALPAALQPGDVIVLDVRFRPTSEKDPPPEATITVGSNDPKKPEVKVVVTGAYASPTPPPSPSASPSPSPTASAPAATGGGGGPDFGDYLGELAVLAIAGGVLGGLVFLRKLKFRRIRRRIAGAS